jgi:hypothetical protein
MKKLYFLDEEEKNRILNIHEGATKRQYLSEQTLSVDEQIAKQFYDTGALGGGTNPDEMFNALNKITSAEQFWKVNELVKNRPRNSGKLDIAGVINDEFEYYGEEDGESNKLDLDKIIAKLTTLGITSTIGTANSAGKYKAGTFKITSQPIVTAATNTLNPKFTDTATACIKQFGGDIKNSSTPGYSYVDLTDGSTLFFMTNYGVKYENKDKSIINGNWSCKGGILNIVLTDGSTWSKAQGGWKGKGSGNQTAVVDPKKAYQERAKQVNLQTQTTTKQIQKSLGQEETGALDSANVERMIDLLKQ